MILPYLNFGLEVQLAVAVWAKLCISSLKSWDCKNQLGQAGSGWARGFKGLFKACLQVYLGFWTSESKSQSAQIELKDCRHQLTTSSPRLCTSIFCFECSWELSSTTWHQHIHIRRLKTEHNQHVSTINQLKST